MASSLIHADRSTHVKIVVTALIGATLVVIVGLSARLAGSSAELARAPVSATVVKAGQPVTVTSSSGSMVR